MESRFARYVRWGIVAAILAIGPAAGALPPDGLLPDDLDVDGSMRTGVQYLDLDEDEAKFNEYRNIDKNFGVVLEEVWLRGYTGAWHFLVEGEDLDREDDRSARVEGGRWGIFELGLGWDETPHNFAENAPFLGTLRNGSYWAMPDIVQQTLEPDFPLGGNPPNSPTANGVTNLLDLLDHAPRLDLGLVRETGTIDATYTPFRRFDIRSSFLHEDRKGDRPLSTGVYLRDSDGANLVSGVGENFTLYGLEFPEPIDYDTDQFDVGLRYRGEGWHTDLSYRFVSFDNNIGTVMWDNPLRFTSVDNVPYGAAINELDLFPSSHSHLLSFTGGISDLPLHSRFTATASWGRVLQNDDFQAFTVNPALTVVGGPNAGLPAATLPLPADDLDGEVNTLLVNALLNSRPIDPLSVNLRFNYYDYDDESDRITFSDGWARIGESVWSAPADAGVVNRVPDWERIRPSADVSYRVNDKAMLLADYTFESYNRNDDRNADTDENVAGGQVKLTPTEWAWLRVGYHWARREIDSGYSPAPADQFFEWEELRMFDQSDRTRNRVDAFLSVDPCESLSLGFGVDWRDDEYDTDFYGLHERSGYTTGVDATWVVSERATVSAHYSRDFFDTRMRLRSKSDAAGGGSFAVPENDWITKIEDVTNTVGGSVSVSLIPEKLTLKVGADYSFAESEFDSFNPDFVGGVTTSSATAYDWPDVEIKTTQLRTELEYHWTERLSTGIRYLYERFDLNDFATDSVVPYGNATDLQGNRLDYFIFMDSNFGDFDAHLITMTVSYAF